MTIKDQAFTAFGNLGRRKLRSTLASLGVIVGTVTIVMMVSLTAGVRRQINRQFESMGLNRITILPAGSRPGELAGFMPFDARSLSGTNKIITVADVTRWRGMSGVSKVSAEVNLPASVGVDLKWKDAVKPVRMTGFRPTVGSPFESLAEPLAGSLELPEQGGVVLSRGALAALGVSSNGFAGLIGTSVEAILRTSRGERQSFLLRVHGISEESSPAIQVSADDRLAMKSWWFNRTNLLAEDGYDLVTIQAADVHEARELAPQFRNEGFRVQTLEMFMEGANRILTAVAVMLTLIGSIALLVASIGIANTMVMAIYERTREIGILKALGASRAEIRLMFMLEAGFLGLIGGLCGLLLGWGIGVGLNHAIAWFMRYRSLPFHGEFFVISFGLAGGTLICSTLIGTLAGLLPAHRAANLDPLEALRHE